MSFSGLFLGGQKALIIPDCCYAVLLLRFMGIHTTSLFIRSAGVMKLVALPSYVSSRVISTFFVTPMPYDPCTNKQICYKVSCKNDCSNDRNAIRFFVAGGGFLPQGLTPQPPRLSHFF